MSATALLASLDPASRRRVVRRLYRKSPATLALEVVPEGGWEALHLALLLVELRRDAALRDAA